MALPIPPHDLLVVPVAHPERTALRQQCYDVRIAVFHCEQGFPLDTEIDDLDDAATHILLRLVPSHEPVGTIRCTKHDGYYKLSRLAVLKDYRQFRFGRALVLALHDYAKKDAKHTPGDLPFVTIKAHSQIPVKGFYARFGYESQGDEFDEDGAPHQLMVARLPISDADS
ncbi:acyl-CoA N-acyltransferase [Laetiporus sulphureus 93-53]|uniref:Acyl-CoA N-acyltransferase n=1 Tax=Laetiporus sulphureus 93-53 TaxID=1314785 RepID=A0A165E7M8_9APHY|nr:acyl-CoA N-acyltransferase [Laetiporus sulphureus 93-53]KZT06396.1 acyl-CoA N-acyltransferase [Laetiporus sulphureus 93-53]